MDDRDRLHSITPLLPRQGIDGFINGRWRRNCHLITICLFATAKAGVQRCRPGDWRRSVSWSRTTTASTLVVSGTACREMALEHLKDGRRVG
jgi:hypothetical protein